MTISRFKFPLILFFIGLFVSGAIQAQEQKQTARLVDEFGYEHKTRTIVRLETLARLLLAEPNARAYVLAYRHRLELPGYSARTLNWARSYLTSRLAIARERVVLIDAGIDERTITELWIVPNGSTPKVRESYQQIFTDPDLPRKFDEYYHPLEKDWKDSITDYEGSYGFIYQNSLKAFAEAIETEPQSVAYVIVYPQYYLDTFYKTDSRGNYKTYRGIRRDGIKTVAAVSSEIKKTLTAYKIPLSRIRVVNGGYRKLREVELWIMSRGTHPPVATPNVFPKTGRKRGR